MGINAMRKGTVWKHASKRLPEGVAISYAARPTATGYSISSPSARRTSAAFR